jgi:hypothetical protein
MHESRPFHQTGRPANPGTGPSRMCLIRIKPNSPGRIEAFLKFFCKKDVRLLCREDFLTTDFTDFTDGNSSTQRPKTARRKKKEGCPHPPKSLASLSRVRWNSNCSPENGKIGDQKRALPVCLKCFGVVSGLFWEKRSTKRAWRDRRGRVAAISPLRAGWTGWIYLTVGLGACRT